MILILVFLNLGYAICLDPIPYSIFHMRNIRFENERARESMGSEGRQASSSLDTGYRVSERFIGTLGVQANITKGEKY